MRTAVLAMVVGASPVVGGCDRCGGGVWLQTRTLRAELRAADGLDGLSSTQTLTYDDIGAAATAPRWEAAIADATTAPTGWGGFDLVGADKGLSLVLPFPVVMGQTLPMASLAPVVPGFDYDLGRPGGESLHPRDAVSAWLTYTAPGPACSRQAPEICEALEQIRRQQNIAGTVRVTAVRPLQLDVNAVVSYPTESGWPPVALRGDVSFGVSAGELCQPES